MISIIIVNYNGKKRLQKCFDSINNQTYRDFEVIMVDNGSSDDSISYAQSNYPQIKIVKSPNNLGFAWGNNLWVKEAKWEYILLLNNDTLIKENLLEKMINTMIQNPNIWILQPKLVYMNHTNKIDNLWWFFTKTWFLYYRWNDKNINESIYQKAKKVFTVKWACAITRSSIIDKIWLFDDDFWSYYEETDFCHRVINLWYECRYYPNTTCYHFNWWTSNDKFPNEYIQFHNFKNKICSFIKNFDTWTLVKFIPIYILFTIAISIIWLVKWKYKHFLAIYKAFWRNIINIKKNLIKRDQVFSFKKNNDKILLNWLIKNPKLIYYYYLMFNKISLYKDKD